VSTGHDLLTPVVEEAALHSNFKILSTSAGYAPARETLREVFARFPSPDGNFIRDFQTAGFDARIWELYVYAVGIHTGFYVQRPHERPDFLFQRDGIRVWIEAVTANPSQTHDSEVPGKGASEEDLIHYYEEAVPIRLGGALYSKLTREKPYWELPHVAGEPLVLAIADFSDPDWFRVNAGALTRYLYGLEARVVSSPGDPVKLLYLPLDEHKSSKTIPSGFFNLANAEHISAVMFSCEGTLSKFNRMGFRFDRHPFVRLMRIGGKYSFNPAMTIPDTFGYLVGDFPEEWRHGVYVFHNPRALHPIPYRFFSRLGQHWLEDGQLNNRMLDFSPMSSVTLVFASKQEKRAFSASADEKLRLLVQLKAKQWDAVQARQAGYAWRSRA
jgi:hypothetical protein